MSNQKQDKNVKQLSSEATAKQAIPETPTEELSSEDLDRVAGGIATVTITVNGTNDAPIYTVAPQTLRSK